MRRSSAALIKDEKRIPGLCEFVASTLPPFLAIVDNPTSSNSGRLKSLLSAANAAPPLSRLYYTMATVSKAFRSNAYLHDRRLAREIKKDIGAIVAKLSRFRAQIEAGPIAASRDSDSTRLRRPSGSAHSSLGSLRYGSRMSSNSLFGGSSVVGNKTSGAPPPPTLAPPPSPHAAKLQRPMVIVSLKCLEFSFEMNAKIAGILSSLATGASGRGAGRAGAAVDIKGAEQRLEVLLRAYAARIISVRTMAIPAVMRFLERGCLELAILYGCLRTHVMISTFRFQPGVFALAELRALLEDWDGVSRGRFVGRRAHGIDEKGAVSAPTERESADTDTPVLDTVRRVLPWVEPGNAHRVRKYDRFNIRWSQRLLRRLIAKANFYFHTALRAQSDGNDDEHKAWPEQKAGGGRGARASVPGSSTAKRAGESAAPARRGERSRPSSRKASFAGGEAAAVAVTTSGSRVVSPANTATNLGGMVQWNHVEVDEFNGGNIPRIIAAFAAKTGAAAVYVLLDAEGLSKSGNDMTNVNFSAGMAYALRGLDAKLSGPDDGRVLAGIKAWPAVYSHLSARNDSPVTSSSGLDPNLSVPVFPRVPAAPFCPYNSRLIPPRALTKRRQQYVVWPNIVSMATSQRSRLATFGTPVVWRDKYGRGVEYSFYLSALEPFVYATFIFKGSNRRRETVVNAFASQLSRRLRLLDDLAALRPRTFADAVAAETRTRPANYL